MRKFLFSILALVQGTMASHAQTVSDFEALSLSKADTYYVNYTSSMHDVGFTNGDAFFSCFYDTSFGGFWSSGFAYSNMTDSVTSGFTNQYSAKAAKGYGGSAKYAAVTTGGGSIKVHLVGSGIGKAVAGFYVCNSTYAYNSMKNGDAFAKKFGGTSGNDSDWFKLTVVGYHNGAVTANHVDFYLADYRSATKYIIKFSLSSSDTSTFGMNTPAFFCMDNFTVNDANASVSNVSSVPIAKVYPNPAKESLVVELNDNVINELSIMDMSGRVVEKTEVNKDRVIINTSTLKAGVYLLQFTGANKTATMRFVKE
jgi:hypothetical protein